jgi:peptide/nickel transport system permease protein
VSLDKRALGASIRSNEKCQTTRSAPRHPKEPFRSGTPLAVPSPVLIFIARRLVWTVIVIGAVLLVTFLVFFKLPAGDPALPFAGPKPTPETLAEVRHRLHFDQPVYVQFGYYVKNFVAGDENGWPGLGYSYHAQVSVKEQLEERAPRTLWLIFGASVLWLTFGVAIGVLSAVKRRSALDRTAMGFSLFWISAPIFWLGPLALFVFWRKLGWTGGSGYVPLSEGVCCGQDTWLMHMILPWTVLSLGLMAIYARVTRNTLLETLGEDFIRTARAKGLPEQRVILRHGLRASLTPIVTMFGLDVALLIGGAIITESVFNLQGLGWLAYSSYRTQDLPVVLGVVLLAATAVVIMNLVIDIVYALLDPRVRYGTA